MRERIIPPKHAKIRCFPNLVGGGRGSKSHRAEKIPIGQAPLKEPKILAALYGTLHEFWLVCFLVFWFLLFCFWFCVWLNESEYRLVYQNPGVCKGQEGQGQAGEKEGQG